jgi:hypothetical protein
MEPEVWKAEPTLGELFNDLSRETKQLVRQEIQLARLELKDSATRMGRGAGFTGAGAALGVLALFSLVATIIALLSQFMAVWLAALLVTAAIAAAAYFLVHKGIEIIKQTELAPRETIETVREDVVWLKKKR